MKPMRVLYIDGVGPFGGAQRSLYEAIRAMPDGAVHSYFLVQKGTANQLYAEHSAGMVTVPGLTRFDNTAYSYYRGVRWLVLLRELAYLPSTIYGLIAARLKFRNVDLVHVNEVTEIIPGLLARWLFRAPLIVHVRSPQRLKGTSWRDRWLERLLKKYAAVVISIDETVKSTMPAVPSRVIHNSFAPRSHSRRDVAYAAKIAALGNRSLKVGFVGNIHRAKGIYELLEAAEKLVARKIDFQILVLGGSTGRSGGPKWFLLNLLGLAQNQMKSLQERLVTSPAKERFHLLGSTWDIENVLPMLDVVAFPCHADAPGRPVIEAAYFSVPSIVAVERPKEDTVRHMETAIAIASPSPELIADAIAYLAEHRDEVVRMGKNAALLAEENFNPSRNAHLLIDLYGEILTRAATGR